MSESTVFIVDDDPSIRKGLTRLLSVSGISVESFNSACDFLAEWKCDRPGCILLDVHMPDMTGPEMQRKLLHSDCFLPLIFLTAYGDAYTATRAMKMGAVDFLEKPVNKDDLLEAIRIALERDKELREKRVDNYSLMKKIEKLTLREHEVMTYVITGSLNKQIAHEMNISEETVKIHRGRMMKKLEITSVAELVWLCVQAGITPSQSLNLS